MLRPTPSLALPADDRGLKTVISLVLAVGILYFVSPVLIPLALAVMLNLLLAPGVSRMQRAGVPRVVAILLTVLLAFSAIGILGWIMTSQVLQLAEELPQYEDTLRGKIRALRGTDQESGVWGRAGKMMEGIATDLEPGNDEIESTDATSAAGSLATSGRPVPVEITRQEPNVVEALREVIGPLLGPAGTAGLVVVLVIAMLFQREDLRDRFVRLVGGGQLNVATEAIDDGVKRISRYLRMQLLVNAAYGIPVGIGLYFIGIPNAALWGLLATLLRFIPYLGPWLAAAFPLTLAFVVDPGWTKLSLTLALFLALELISNNILEPWLYGVSTGISNFALMMAAVFWTWLWGPVGLFLSTPLTVCLVVIGTYIPALKFISVMLGNAPALDYHARLYQRMLAMDYSEMLALSRQYVAQSGHAAFYEQVLIPALIAAETDRHDGSLAEVRQQSILENTRDLIEALGDEEAGEAGEAEELSSGEAPVRVAIAPALDDIDEVAGLILVQMLARKGIDSVALSARATSSDWQEQVSQSGVEVVCISSVPPAALAPARAVCRKLMEVAPGVTRLVGVWSPTAAVDDIASRLMSGEPHAVMTRLEDAVNHIATLVDKPSDSPMEAPAIPECENERLAEIARLDLLNGDPDEVFDAVTKQLASVFDVPISLVSIIDTTRQVWKSQAGLPEDLARAGEASRELSVCGHVVALNQPVVVEDIAKDGRFANNPFLVNRGIRFYAGVPLRGRNGTAVGSLCVIDTKPRKVRKRDVAMLTLLAEQLMQSVERRKSVAA